MNHLSPAEFVDLLDGTLDGRRAAHAAECERCRASAAEARVMLELASDPSVPEPSPLFWDHFSARVRDAVAAEPPARVGIGWRPAVAAAAAVVVFVTAIGTLVLRRAPVHSESATDSPVVAVADMPATFDTTLDANTDVWEVLTAAAADLEWDAAHQAGMGVSSGAVDRAVQRLSADELNELGRLLQLELKRGAN